MFPLNQRMHTLDKAAVNFVIPSWARTNSIFEFSANEYQDSRPS
jgi:hypothetical protein